MNKVDVDGSCKAIAFVAGAIVVGSVLGAPVIVPTSMIYGIVTTPIHLIQGIRNKISLNHCQKKSSVILRGMDINQIRKATSSLTNATDIRYVKKQIQNQIKFDKSRSKLAFSAKCILPFGFYWAVSYSKSFKKRQSIRELKEIARKL